MEAVHVSTSPSLALIKYWGKAAGGANIPATTSIAVGLETLRTETTVTGRKEPRHDHRQTRDDTPHSEPDGEGDDYIRIADERQQIGPFRPVIDNLRDIARAKGIKYFEQPVEIRSRNSFPTAAGIASSSSGFAAVVLALNAYWNLDLTSSQLSSIARLGSGSAARSVYGGYTILRAAAHAAEQLHPGSFWPDLRVVVAIVSTEKKSVGSRAGMESSRTSSPYYEAWVEDSKRLCSHALEALAARDIEQLGELMRLSYLRMVGCTIASAPPLLYWLPPSVALIHRCAELRAAGHAAWETMDAGPQVKVLTTAGDAAAVRAALAEIDGVQQVIETTVGGDPTVSIDPGPGSPGVR